MRQVIKVELTVEMEGGPETFVIEKRKRNKPPYRDRYMDPLLLQFMASLTILGLASELPFRTEVSARRWRLVRQKPAKEVDMDGPVSQVRKRPRNVRPSHESGDGSAVDRTSGSTLDNVTPFDSEKAETAE
jgi:hypothetical protein